MVRAYFNWSGGKDSALSLWKIQQEKKFNIDYLLTSVNSVYNRVSMHGVRRSLLEAQANSIGIPLTTIELPEEPDMNEYEEAMMQKVNWLKSQGINHSIFGDIFLEDLRKYREEKLAQAGIEAVFPIWKQDTTELLWEFLKVGFKTIVVCTNEKFLDKSFCGRVIDESFINDLPSHIDPCGENGEFHTFAFDGPIFRQPIAFNKGEIVYKEYKAPLSLADEKKYGFYFCDLLPG